MLALAEVYSKTRPAEATKLITQIKTEFPSYSAPDGKPPAPESLRRDSLSFRNPNSSALTLESEQSRVFFFVTPV